MNLLNVICVFLSVANRSNPLGIKHSSNMAFVSTRGSSSASFSQMIFTGFCEDGGILLPKTLKTYSKDQLWSFRDLTFSELCFEVLRHYCDDMPEEDLRLVVLGSHDSFGHSDVISVVPLESGVSIAELFFGPTHAFKDLAMQVLGRLVSFVLAKQNRHARCVVSTTGDTGPASIAALKGKKNVDIFVLFPLFPAISRTQEMQMIASEDSNVHVIGTKSSADDNDEAMRQLFKSAPKDVGLTTMNSINCARLLCGVAQFIFCYLKVAKSMDDQVK
jgi:threonine synthase